MGFNSGFKGLNSFFNKYVAKFRRMIFNLNNAESFTNFTKQGIITKKIALCRTVQ